MWKRGLEPLSSWKSKTAKHAAKRKADRSEAQGKSKARKVYDCVSDRDTVDQPSVNFVNVPYYKETGRVVCVSDNEQVDAGGEGFGSTPATLELDSAMGVGSRIIPSTESNDESERRVVYRSDRELVNTS